MILRKTLFVAVVSLFAFGAAAEEPVVEEATTIVEKDLFDAIDADKSGTISLEEAKVNAKLNEAFASLDLDGDEQLSLEEFANLKVKV